MCGTITTQQEDDDKGLTKKLTKFRLKDFISGWSIFFFFFFQDGHFFYLNYTNHNILNILYMIFNKKKTNSGQGGPVTTLPSTWYIRRKRTCWLFIF